MILPIYVSLEKIDRRLVEAAADLYCSPARAFAKVVLPLSLPGVFAGSLLTFIPASGDFINAELLGSPNQQMIGTVIQNQFLEVRDYPLASSLSFVLMAGDHARRARLRPRCSAPRSWRELRRRGPDRGRRRGWRGPGPRRRRRPGPALPLRADLRHRALQLQPAGREVQLRLEGLLARRLAGPVQVPAAGRRDEAVSLKVAAISTGVAIVFGTLIALALCRYQLPRQLGGRPAAGAAAHHARGRARLGAAVALPRSSIRAVGLRAPSSSPTSCSR